jgi:hypothetical protein
MYKKLILLLIVFGVLAGFSNLASALPLIGAVDRSGGNSGDRAPIGPFDGETDPLPTQAGGWTNGNYCFSDREYTWANTPPEIDGAEYVRTFNTDKDSSVTYTVTFPIGATVLLTCDNRFTPPQDYVDNIVRDFAAPGEFTDTGWDVYVGGDGDPPGRPLSVYSAVMRPGTYVFHDQASGSNNFYIIGALEPPYQPLAFNPNPADGAIDVPVDTVLTWERGDYALQDQVYFGTDPVMTNLPHVATILDFQPVQWAPPEDLVASTTYYWYIVEVDSNMPHKPDEPWSFTTVRGECRPDFPKDGAVIPGAPMGDDIYTTLDFFPGATNVRWTGYFHYDYDKVDSRAQDANLGHPPYGGYRYYAGLYAVPPWTDSLVRGTVYYWTVDGEDSRGNMFPSDIWEFAIQGYYAFAPTPPNEATFINTDVRLAWKPGYGVVDHDIYIGTSYEAVRDARYDFNEPCVPPEMTPYVGPDEYYMSRSEPNVMITGLPYLTKHYWRVDEVKGRLPPPMGGGTYYFGPVWNFTTLPEGIGTVTGAIWLDLTTDQSPDRTNLYWLYDDPDFPANPDQTQELTSFDSETVLPDLSDYGGMIHGWLHVAKSGDYRFWLATDDMGELYLSTDQDPTNMSRIAFINGYASAYNWYDPVNEDGLNQVSALIPLVTGQKYYIRACWKEGGGGDHCMVAWQGPDQPIVPVAGSTAQVIPGSRLSPFVQLWAHSPEPRNGQMGVVSPVTLRWGPGDTAAKHDVYLSTSRALVDSRDASAYMGRRDPNTYGPIMLETGAVYYWAIDEVNDLGPEPGIWYGPTWLFRAEGGAGGLQGLYYHWDGILPPAVPGITDPGPANPFQIFVLSRIDPEVNFNWGDSSPDPNIHVDDFACRWVGHVECPVDANYTFYTTTDDGARLFIDGIQLLPIAAWQQQGMTEWSGSVILSPGLHDIEMHHEEHVGGAGAELRWSAIPINPADHAIPKQIIPPIWLWPPLFATGPNPPHLATVDNRKPALEWIPGLYALSHELYFSANYDDVNDRNPLVRQILIDPCRPYPAAASPLQLGRTYYWLVDEVKSVTERWDARRVWEFTVNECISIDNFEDYNDRGELRLVWTDGYANVIWGGTYPYHYVIRGGSSGSNLNLSSAVGNPAGGTGPVRPTPLNYDAMVLRYDNDGLTYTGLPGAERWIYDAPYFSEIEKDTVSSDWSGEGIKALSLWFQGHPLSDGSYNATGWPLYTVSGRGRDIWGRHDEFFFLGVYPLTGSGTIQVKITDMDNTNPWAKAGVMIRDKWAPYSKFAAVYMTPGNGVTFQWRENEDAVCDSRTKPGVTVPQYLKLERTFSGNFIAKHSDTTAIVWQDVNSTTAPEQPTILMGVDDPNIYIGTAVTSHNALETCTAGFDTVEVFATPTPGTWVFGNIGTNDANQLYVALSDSTKTVVVNHPDPNAATLTGWQEWNIELTDFAGLNLSDVQKVHIGVGDRVTHPEPGGSGALYIDDIRACPPRCVPSFGKPSADIAQPYDCIVDEKDIRALAGDWLLSDEFIVAWEPSISNLVAYWPLSTDFLDYSGNNFHGTASGGASLVTDTDRGQVLSLDRIDDFVNCGNPTDPCALDFGTGNWTVCAWVKTTMTGTGDENKGSIIGKGGDNTGGHRYALGVSEVTEGILTITTDDNVDKRQANGSTLINDGEWHHVVGMRDGSSLRVYVDGLPEGENDTLPAGYDLSGTHQHNAYIGAITDNRDGSQYKLLGGRVDEVRIYSYALSAGEVVYLATDGAAGLHLPIISEADLYTDEPQGSQWINLKDYSVIAEQYLEKILWP